MAFEIRPVREFLVRPAIPPALKRLEELAYNLYYSWDPMLRSLFRRLDAALWRNCGRNAALLLGRVSQETLERAAANPNYLALYRQCCDRFDAYTSRLDRRPDGKLTAYFCMEYGLVECLPIYSGGLGVLAGDFLKSLSDRGESAVGVGLLYQKGYLEQFLDADGWQQERYPVNDFYTMPMRPVTDGAGQELKISVELPKGPAYARVWRVDVGRIPLFLLDTNIEENAIPEYRDITDQLYGGELRTRIHQEIVLGIGGLAALRALDLKPTVYHMNEGHSAFLALERIRLLIREEGLSFEEALEAARANNVFTTHTSVAAGIDLFPPGLMQEYFSGYCAETGVEFERLMALGRWDRHNSGEPFSMAILALRASSLRNAVSRLHREVSQKMWSGLWPELPAWEAPITSITNGVHLRSWLNTDLTDLYDEYLRSDWRESCRDAKSWQAFDSIPDTELLEVHRRRKRRLVAFVRERTAASATARKAPAAEVRRLSQVLDPDALTLGFARRSATYKRSTLIFRDIERLKRIFLNPQRPVQIVIAGNAHPQDEPGKQLILQIVRISRDPELASRVVFVENYDMRLARELVQGVDLWLNNPRRGEEACGTSGIKAAMNGVLNLSVLDGWFDEAYEQSGGWAIGGREPYSEEQDEIHARAIYSLLENEIVPMYYDRDANGVPVEWMRRVRQSIRYLGREYNCQRMAEDYDSQVYGPAHAAWSRMRENGFERVRERVRWMAHVSSVWDDVKIVEIEHGGEGRVLSGRPVEIRAKVDLAGLKPEDVRVEAAVGRVGPNGTLEEAEVLELPPVVREENGHVFGRQIRPEQTGRLGYSVRITPNHCEDPLTRPCNPLMKWALAREGS